jgi:ribonuclease-3
MAVRDPVDPDVSSRHVSRLEQAQIWLGHRFERPDLLAEALTHRSAAGAKGVGSNERLEFIGDRVLGLAVAEWLIERFPHEQEGKLGPRLAALVSKPALAAAAEIHNLSAFLTVARGEAKRGVSAQATVLADAMEAVIGALYLDAGLPAARNFVRRMLGDVMERQFTPPKDPKTALQEWVLKRALPLPVYSVEEISGPSHAPRFVVAVAVGERVARGESGSKRAAEQAAARAILEILPA